jgi:hypothetical protein
MPFCHHLWSGGRFEISASDDDGLFCDDPKASLSAVTSKIARSMSIVAEITKKSCG